MGFGQQPSMQAGPAMGAPKPMGGMGAPVPGVTPPTPGSGYPDASQIPELQDAPTTPPPGMENAANPVIVALQTLQTLTAAMQEQNNPKAEGVKAGLLQIVQSLGNAGGAPPVPGQDNQPSFNPFEAPTPEASPEKMGGNMMSEMANNEAKPLV